MWLFLNVELNSKSFKTDLAENFLYDWSESEKIETSRQNNMYTDFWAWLSSETKLFFANSETSSSILMTLLS